MTEFKHGLCGCFDNCGLCIVTYIAPCYTVGKNAEALGDSCCCHCILFFIPLVNLIVRTSQRGRIRERQGIEGGTCGDLLCVLFCPFCSLVQEAQECKEMMGGGMSQEIERA